MLDTNFSSRTTHIVLVLTLVLVAVASFLAGRGTKGVQIVERVTHHETETRLQTINTVQKVDLAELTKLVQEQFAKLQKNVKVDQTTERRPDGTEVTHTVTTDNSTSESGSKTSSEADRRSTSTTDTKSTLLDQKLTVDEKSKSVESAQASWDVGVLATYQPFFAPPGFNLLPEQRLTLGLDVSHRLFGPVWVGGVLTTTAALGLHLHLLW